MIANSEIIMKLRRGEIDCNNQELFFSHVIKGLLLKLNEDITIRSIPLPHFILHTGDDIMYLHNKGQDASIEPLNISNENYVYNTIPRCLVNMQGVDILPDQLTNPYSKGSFQLDIDNSLYTLVAEFRRMPIKFTCELKYHLDSYKDTLELIQHIISKLCFIRTYKIVYMGQIITCSYKIPESFSEEHMLEIEGTTSDSKYRTISLSLEVETNLPVFEPRTIISSTDYISKVSTTGESSTFRAGLYKKDDIENGGEPTDIIKLYKDGIDERYT